MALKAIMPPRFGLRHEDWLRAPVFRQQGTGKAWTKSSYTKGWAAVKEALAGDYPEIAGMWLRDLRVVARTVLRRSGIASEVSRRFLGHSAVDVDADYDRVTVSDLRGAAEALHIIVYAQATTRADAASS